jgi:hypothetical protein
MSAGIVPFCVLRVPLVQSSLVQVFGLLMRGRASCTEPAAAMHMAFRTLAGSGCVAEQKTPKVNCNADGFVPAHKAVDMQALADAARAGGLLF